MSHLLSRTALLACVLGSSLVAQTSPPQKATDTRADAAAGELIRLRHATFDPARAEPTVPEGLGDTGNLWIVQFVGLPTQAARDALRATGVRLHGYLPDNAYVVRMPATQVNAVRGLAATRWVGRYHAAYRLDPVLLAALAQGQLSEVRHYNIVVTDKHTDKPALAGNINRIGGQVVHPQEGSLLFTVALTGAQLQQAAAFDEVLWIDEWTAPQEDMNNVRIQGGGNYIEAQAGYTGAGVGAHIYEGIEATHQDFTGGAVNVRSNGGADTHGHCTAGIVFGNGTSNPAVRGMAPDATKFFTQYGSVSGSRWQVVSDLVNIHNVSHTTASWGGARTLFYTSVSADADDLVFDHDIAWTQSQSNAGNQQSRPEAWAKNVISIGGVAHGNNSNPLDDSWAAGGGSTGPAADGRIKPDLSAYYDGIGTSDRTGSAGYSSGNWYASFGGTSGATPIVAGHNVLAIQMFTDDSASPGVGPFGNTLRVPNGTTHQNRPHFTTLKSLQVVSARQYAFNASSTDNRRNHVGWGFPNLRTMWDMRHKTFIVDETDVLTQGVARRWDVAVAPGEPVLSAVLNYAEPAANPAAAITLVNNLSLRVTSPTGAIYWGNYALEQGNWSIAGGTEDNLNPIECVFVQNPPAGTWHIDVIATSIVADSHVETPAMDADYGLVVTGGTGGQSTAAFFVEYGQGCAGSTNVVTPCVALNGTGGTLTGQTDTNEYLFIVSSSSSMQVQSFDLFTQSTGGTVIRPVHIYGSLASGALPIASSTMAIGPTAGFYRATFPVPVPVGVSFHLVIDVSSQDVFVPNLTSGTTGVAFSRAPNTPIWVYNASVTRPAYRVDCTAGTVYSMPELSHTGQPVLGSSYDLLLSDALASAPALLMTGLSDEVYNGTPLPYSLPGAPGCSLLAAPTATMFVFTSAAGAASYTIGVPNSPSYIGLELFHQWAVLDPANPLGIVVSDAGLAHVGT